MDLRQLSAENQRLRNEVAATAATLAAVSEAADEEGLTAAKMRNKLKKAGKGIKNIFAQEDESYIEIIIP